MYGVSVKKGVRKCVGMLGEVKRGMGEVRGEVLGVGLYGVSVKGVEKSEEKCGVWEKV